MGEVAAGEKMLPQLVLSLSWLALDRVTGRHRKNALEHSLDVRFPIDTGFWDGIAGDDRKTRNLDT